MNVKRETKIGLMSSKRTKGSATVVRMCCQGSAFHVEGPALENFVSLV